jgi:inorganic phosphate transporter, PiT family
MSRKPDAFTFPSPHLHHTPMYTIGVGSTPTLVLVICVALAFDFTNGFHDAANAIATSVATRSISPRLAVICAGVLNFAGAFLSLKVASTIGKGIVDPSLIGLSTILAGLVGAITWNLVTWWFGIPSSSSHALIGGIIGAAVVGAGGLDPVRWSGIYHKVLIPSVLAPFLGFGLAAVLAILVAGRVGRWLDARPRPLRGLQLASAGFVALTHGTNDAQKTMGVITLALVSSGHLKEFAVPDWTIAASALAIALGTYSGGWRIITTLGSRLSTLDLRAGTAAQVAAGSMLWATAHAGYPVSTTHIVTGSVLGSGAGRRFRGTSWSLGMRIVIAWLVTLPAAAAVGGLFALILDIQGGEIVLAIALVVLLAIAVRFRRSLLSGPDAGLPPPPAPAPVG